MDIFISYKHQGSTNNSINEICQNLKKAGIKYFIDNEQLSLGDNIVNYENSIGVMNALSYHPLGGELIKINSVHVRDGLCLGLW